MQDIANELRKLFSEEKLKLSLIDRYAFAGDAGFYYLLPQAVVQPDLEQEIDDLFQFARKHKVPLTFRTGGTSLSGQSITDGILVDLSKHWNRIYAMEGGKKVIFQPAAIGAHVNHHLKPFSTKIGPDPASISAAMMGGILSNNSSGMCCGVTNNSYHTLHSIRFILPNGNVYDTSTREHYFTFQATEEKISDGIVALQQKILANETLVQKIRSKYRIKNTVGYGINAFIDYKHPLDVLAHLIIGAEGTLAFISEAVLNTIPDKPGDRCRCGTSFKRHRRRGIGTDGQAGIAIHTGYGELSADDQRLACTSHCHSLRVPGNQWRRSQNKIRKSINGH